MIRLFNIEFQKLWKNRSSKVLTITYFVLLTLIFLLASLQFDVGPFHVNFAEQGVFNFPFIWHVNTYLADFYKIFLAVVIVSMMANEYSYGTLNPGLTLTIEMPANLNAQNGKNAWRVVGLDENKNVIDTSPIETYEIVELAITDRIQLVSPIQGAKIPNGYGLKLVWQSSKKQELTMRLPKLHNQVG